MAYLWGDFTSAHTWAVVNCFWSTCFFRIARLDVGVAPRVVAAGLRCIVSDQNNWYLDHLSTTWQQFYMNEPLTNITNPAHQKLVLGGEVCMWGETVDGSDIEQTIWPRAAAAAGTSFDTRPLPCMPIDHSGSSPFLGAFSVDFS